MTIRFASNLAATALLALVSLGLAACGDDGSAASSSASAAGSSAGTIVSSSPQTDTLSNPASPGSSQASQAAPQISGKSVASVNAGAKYQFTPTVSAGTRATLAFSVQNKPDWASFDSTSGTLSGTPQAANVGTYSNIVVSVSNGTASASLAAFSVVVTQMSDGTATLDWAPPTENTDGSTLTNLAGYKVYYGTSASNLSESVKVDNPGLSSYTLSNLSPGTWYFAVSAVSAAGVESSQSPVVTATL